MRTYRFTLTVLCFILITACGSDHEPLERIPDDGVILAFGDSLTFGSGVKPAESYPAILQRLSGRKVINAGVPGEVTSNGVKRLPLLLNKHQPDLLILIHGGNDMLRKKKPGVAANNLRLMIGMARSKDIPVIMMAVPNPTLILSPASFYEEVATDMQVPIEIDAISDILQYPSNKSDAIHPNTSGYRMMAESVYDLLQSLDAI